MGAGAVTAGRARPGAHGAAARGRARPHVAPQDEHVDDFARLDCTGVVWRARAAVRARVLRFEGGPGGRRFRLNLNRASHNYH